MKLYLLQNLRFARGLLFTTLGAIPLLLHGVENPDHTNGAQHRSLYRSLNPSSVSQHLAFYELYPDTPEGVLALQNAWKLVGGSTVPQEDLLPLLPKLEIHHLIAFMMRQPSDSPIELTQEQLLLIERISLPLGNRSLKGHSAWSKEEILSLVPEEIDLARGLLLFQWDNSPNFKEKIRQYEASLDLMALQIRAKLSQTPSNEEKIREINHFIFQEMQFRFPPHSLYAHDIDLYTFLPSVLDQRQGVCLGVSILYLSLAQRLHLPMEVITPPGHIYVRYRDGEKIINVETTARGIDLPSETYLGINTRSLQQRNIKEVIGLTFMNEAALFWARQDYEKVVQCYEKAALFLREDPLLKLFMGLNLLFVEKQAEGKKLLNEICHMTFPESVSRETFPEDYLSGRIDIAGLKAVFLPVDETRESILNKQKELQQILKRYPKYRAGLFQLATTWLQLGRHNEAKEVLERHHNIDPDQATIEYYLAALCLERMDYTQSWNYLHNAERLTLARNHSPKALSSVRESLRKVCPEP